MGIFDRFKKEKTEHQGKIEENGPDLDLNYSNGTNAQIYFGDVIDYDGKHLQTVDINYIMANHTFMGKKLYIEPQVGYDENGNAIYATKQYYKSLIESGKNNDVKGFFKQEYVKEIETRDGTNYIGSLTYNERGPLRYYDQAFKSKYMVECAQKRETKAREDKIKSDNQMQEKIQSLINEHPEVHIKENHAKELTREDYEKYHGSKNTKEER